MIHIFRGVADVVLKALAATLAIALNLGLAGWMAIPGWLSPAVMLPSFYLLHSLSDRQTPFFTEAVVLMVTLCSAFAFCEFIWGEVSVVQIAFLVPVAVYLAGFIANRGGVGKVEGA